RQRVPARRRWPRGGRGGVRLCRDRRVPRGVARIQGDGHGRPFGQHQRGRDLQCARARPGCHHHGQALLHQIDNGRIFLVLFGAVGRGIATLAAGGRRSQTAPARERAETR
ncbi:unnamed protein product, partial [Ectocarpus sp. 8 AP-2014]